MPDQTSNLTGRLFDHFATRKPLRTGSLIVTIFGDSVAPRGGVVWIGSIIAALAPLGISQRLVRTAVFRLVQDGILINQQLGRRSFYALTDAGRAQFNAATERIYAQPERTWQGRWHLVLLAGIPAAQRGKVRQALAWLGFGQFGPDTLAHPNVDQARLSRHLQQLGVHEQVVLMQASLAPEEDIHSLQQLVSSTWDLAALERAYDEYIALFEPIAQALRRGQALTRDDAFYIRTFMIHEYRKVVLRDPNLPGDLLPGDWNGNIAYQLSRDLYRRVLSAAEAHIDITLENQNGPLPPLDQHFAARFGGLQDILDGQAA